MQEKQEVEDSARDKVQRWHGEAEEKKRTVAPTCKVKLNANVLRGEERLQRADVLDA